MPLSEHEQRILRQIEQQLEQDPTFAARGYRVSRSRVVLLAVGLVGAIVITVLGLSVSFWLAFGAFLVSSAMRSTWRHHRRGPGSPVVVGSARWRISSSVA